MSDLIGYMLRPLQEIIVDESLRIGRRVFILSSKEQVRSEKSRLECVETSSFLGWHYWTDDELKNLLQKKGYLPILVETTDSAVLFEIQKSDQ